MKKKKMVVGSLKLVVAKKAKLTVAEPNQIASNYRQGEAEALTDEIKEESMIVGEVFRIKEILHNCQDGLDSKRSPSADGFGWQ